MRHLIASVILGGEEQSGDALKVLGESYFLNVYFF